MRGRIELGFMSTTTKRAVAVKYSTENEDKASMIFEIQVSGDQFCRYIASVIIVCLADGDDR